MDPSQLLHVAPIWVFKKAGFTSLRLKATLFFHLARAGAAGRQQQGDSACPRSSLPSSPSYICRAGESVIAQKDLGPCRLSLFFFPPFFSPSPPWSYTPLSAPSLPGAGAPQAGGALAVQSGCGQPGRQLGGPWATCPCKPRASPQSQPGADEMTRAQHSHKAAGFFFLNNFFISGRRKS